MPFLSEELGAWIREHLATLGLEEIAVYAVEDGSELIIYPITGCYTVIHWRQLLRRQFYAYKKRLT